MTVKFGELVFVIRTRNLFQSEEKKNYPGNCLEFTFFFFSFFYVLHISWELIAATTKETKELVRSTQQKSSNVAAVSTTKARAILQETRIQAVAIIGNLELNMA